MKYLRIIKEFLASPAPTGRPPIGLSPDYYRQKSLNDNFNEIKEDLKRIENKIDKLKQV